MRVQWQISVTWQPQWHVHNSGSHHSLTCTAADDLFLAAAAAAVGRAAEVTKDSGTAPYAAPTAIRARRASGEDSPSSAARAAQALEGLGVLQFRTRIREGGR